MLFWLNIQLIQFIAVVANSASFCGLYIWWFGEWAIQGIHFPFSWFWHFKHHDVKLSGHIFLLLFGLWSVYIAYIQVRRPFWWITSSIFVEINGKVCKPAVLVTFKIFSFHIIHRYVLCLYAQEIGVVHRRWHLWRRIYDLYLGWVSGCTYDISCSSKNKKDNSKLWDTFESVVPVDESLVKKYESLAYRLVMELNNVMWTQQSANN